MTVFNLGITYDKNVEEEIAHHESCKHAVVYSYSESISDLPDNYREIDSLHTKSGLDVYTIQNGNDIIIAIRGTEWKSPMDWKSNASNYINNPSKQAKEALEYCKKMQAQYPDANITITGHSGGGGTGGYAAAKLGLPAVTFNPVGTAGLIKEGEYYDDSRIVNYCNPRDWTPSGNVKDFLGKCYEIESKGFTSKAEAGWISHHFIENMEDLHTRKEITKEELTQKYKAYRESMPHYLDTAIEAYKDCFRKIPRSVNKAKEVLKEKFRPRHSENASCAGTYPVSGYTREDGTQAKGYTRTCGAKHSGWQGKRFDEMSDAEIDYWLDELI